MADFTDPSGASLRLSNDERERAVAALQAEAAQGRLTDDELQTRSASARAAVTRGDLAPLFADLPGELHLDAPHPGHAAPAAQGTPAGQATPAAPTAPAASTAIPQQQPYAQAYPDPSSVGAGSPWSDDRRPSNRWGLLVVSVIPFVSVILFFLTGMVWGYQYSWLWFLLIPLVGAITYGADGGRRR